MNFSLEVIIPVRNPTDVFEKTIESLARQTDKNFSVLLSDNFSTSGHEHITRAEALLAAAKIATRKISPPMELQRVEHWNWAHFQSSADWLKPLFAGDWLDAKYVACVREVIASQPQCRYVFTNTIRHNADGTQSSGTNRWAGVFRTPREMQDGVLRYAMQFGPPSAAAYERTAFLSCGGYAPTLPICADSLLFCTLAMRFGVRGIQEPLCHFQMHAARFSTELPGKKRETLDETLTYFFLLAYLAWTERDAFPRGGFLRMLAREMKNYFFAK